MANGKDKPGEKKDKPTASGTADIGNASGTANVGNASGTAGTTGQANDPLSDEKLEKMENTGTTWHHFK